MAVDIGPKDASPKRLFNFTLRRRQCAQCRRSAGNHRSSEADVHAAARMNAPGGYAPLGTTPLYRRLGPERSSLRAGSMQILRGHPHRYVVDWLLAIHYVMDHAPYMPAGSRSVIAPAMA